VRGKGGNDKDIGCCDTAGFVASPEGADWPGNAKNVEIIGVKIAELGLTDAPDKFAALFQAYEALKATGVLFESDDPKAQISKDASPEALLEAWKSGVRISGADPSASFSSLFGRR